MQYYLNIRNRIFSMRQIIRLLSQPFSYALRSPIDIQLLKTSEGRQSIETSLKARFKDVNKLNQLQSNYQLFRKSLYEFEGLSREANGLKKQIKDLVKNNQVEELQKLKQTLAQLKEKQTAKENEVKEHKTLTEQQLLTVGNFVHKQTIISKDQANNKILKYYNPHLSQPIFPGVDTNHKQIQRQHFAVPTLNNNPECVSYQKLNDMFKISDLTRGQKVSGHRGYFLTTNGVKLALGIAQYGLDFLQKKGYDIYQTPALILQEVLRDSCQLNTITEDMYRFTDDGLVLIATSQQTLAGYYRGETIQSKKLPFHMGGYSSCFRREAGAHGKDIHGLFRLHQFEKVQQFVVCQPSESEKQMQKMLATSQEFYQSLKIPYRVIDIVSGQLNDPAVRKIDIQAWFPSQKRFRELVSISNCTDYQSRLLQTKVRNGQTTSYVHMLNGTLVAVQRAMTCFLQHFYNSKTSQLDIPQALQPYVRTKKIDLSSSV